MERPFIQIKRLLREVNKKELDTFKFIFEKSDNISLWIIGLAIGGIAIFANNIADIQNSIPNSYLNSVLTLLTISICCGIIYRILYLYFFIALNNSFGAIDIAFSDYKSMDTKSNLTGSENFNELIVKLKNGFDEDLSYLEEAYKALDNNGKEILYNSIKTHYLKSVEFASQDEENILDFVGDTYSKFIGVKKSKFIKKMKSNDLGKQYKNSAIAVTIFYFTYVISFLLGLIFFVIGYSNSPL